MTTTVDRVAALADLVPPRWDPEVEEALMGSLLDKPGEVWPLVVGRVLPEDFHDPRIAKVWEVVSSLITAGVAINLESVTAALRDAGAAAAVGAPRFLYELTARATTGVWAEQWVKDLLRASAVRRVQRSALNTLWASSQGTYEDVVKEAVGIEKALSERATVDEAVAMSASIEEFTASLGKDADRSITGHTTGFVELDTLLGGLGDGQMITLAARPRLGKTSLGLAMLVAAAKDLVARGERGVCLFVSIEMPIRDINRRLISQLASVTEATLKSPSTISKDALDRAHAAAHALHDLPIYIHDKLEWLHDLRALLYRMRLRHGRVRLVMIDYLQLLRAKLDRRDANREQEVAEISRTLKALAKEFDCPIVPLAQLNRSCETRPGKDKRPMLSDLRESGAVEQDSDVVMFIYRDEVYRPDTEDKGIAEIIVAKQRSGPSDTVRLRFEGHFTRFSDLRAAVERPSREEEDSFPEVPSGEGIEVAYEDSP